MNPATMPGFFMWLNTVCITVAAFGKPHSSFGFARTYVCPAIAKTTFSNQRKQKTMKKLTSTQTQSINGGGDNSNPGRLSMN